MNFDFDLMTIGGGSGGVRASRWAAGLGAKVAICEGDRFGGTCVIRGCVPKKFFFYASHFSSEAKLAKDYGWKFPTPEFHWSEFKQKRDTEIQRLESIYEKMLDKTKVQKFSNYAELIGPHSVKVDGKELTAKYILIATGGVPFIPQIKGAENTLTSNDFFEIDSCPKSAIVVGGGYIGVEFAGILNGLGVEVDYVIRREFVLNGFDQDLREFLQDQMGQKGIRVHAGMKIEQISDQGTKLHFADGSALRAEKIIFATGRVPNTAKLGLTDVGVETDHSGRIQTNDEFQTQVPSIYAIGDCANQLNLTPVATREGMTLAQNLFGKDKTKMNYNFVPTAVFSQPPLATVGLSELDAKSKGIEIEVFKSQFRALKMTLTAEAEQCYLKMIVEKATQKVIGLHMVGSESPEIIQGFAVAVKAGLTKDHFDSTIGIHPTTAEEFVTMRS